MDVGSTLHKARIERGLYIPELVYRTRIRADVIEAIEHNDFSKCGGDVYARGHVRALAAALEVPIEPLLEAMGAPVDAASAEVVEQEPLNIWELQERSRVPSERRLWTIAAIAAVIIIAALVWQSRQGSSKPLPTPTTTASTSASPTASASSTDTASPSPSATDSSSASPTTSATPTATASPVAGSVRLRLDAYGTTWVEVTNASGTVYVGTMRAGDHRNFSSTSTVSVTIGNAVAMTITANGTLYNHLGHSGEVYRGTFPVA